MGYWIWYIVVAIVAWAFKLPSLALLAIIVVFARRWLPDPVEWTRNLRTESELTARIEQYPADLLARRNLARLHIERRHPARAVSLLEEAIAKGMDDPEAFYLLGIGRLRSGDPGSALEPIVKSVSVNQRLFLGEPYFTAAEALVHLGRLDEAEDALERGLAVNSSRIDGHVRLARVREARGNRPGALAAYKAAIETFSASPDYLKWGQFRGYLAAHWGRLRATSKKALPPPPAA